MSIDILPVPLNCEMKSVPSHSLQHTRKAEISHDAMDGSNNKKYFYLSIHPLYLHILFCQEVSLSLFAKAIGVESPQKLTSIFSPQHLSAANQDLQALKILPPIPLSKRARLVCRNIFAIKTCPRRNRVISSSMKLVE